MIKDYEPFGEERNNDFAKTGFIGSFSKLKSGFKQITLESVVSSKKLELNKKILIDFTTST
jgi:hypothetical protein